MVESCQPSIKRATADGAPVVTSGDVIPNMLLAQGIIDSSQIDLSYEGTAQRFVSDPTILQQGFATAEPYIYENEIAEWGKPVGFQLLSEVGYTIYPGSAPFQSMYETLRELTREAKAHGLAVVVWSYPRGSGISKAGETAIDIVAYAAQIAAQLGANIIKVKPPTNHIEQDAARKVFEGQGIPISTLAERVAHVVDSAFGGRRVVIFSGGAKGADEKIFEECRGIRDGGGFGSIIGRNAFQRDRSEALAFLDKVMGIYDEGGGQARSVA